MLLSCWTFLYWLIAVQSYCKQHFYLMTCHYLIRITAFLGSDKLFCCSAVRPKPPIVWSRYTSFLFLGANFCIRWDKLDYAMGTISQCLSRSLFPGSHDMSNAGWQRDSAHDCHSGIKLTGLPLSRHFYDHSRQKEMWRTTFFTFLPVSNIYHTHPCYTSQASQKAMINIRNRGANYPFSLARRAGHTHCTVL